MAYVGYPLFIVAFVLVLWAIGALVASIVLRIRTRRTARAAREALALEGTLNGFTLARGKIVATGPGVGPAGGAKQVVRARFLAEKAGMMGVVDEDASSDGLAIETSGGARTPLEGRIELVVGSRWRWRRASGVRGFHAACALVEGDEVIAAVRAPTLGYREENPAPPAPLQGIVRLATTATPSVGGALGVHLLHRVEILVALLGVVPGWLYGLRYREAVQGGAEACKNFGKCTIGVELTAKRILAGKIFRSRATRDADCVATPYCASLGFCSVKDGECTAAKDEDCKFTAGCLLRGACTATPEGRCMLRKSEDCPREACAVDGRCTKDDDDILCSAHTDADCKQSYACRAEGRCMALGGGCSGPGTPRENTCRGSLECLLDGRCELGAFGSCEATSDADCAASQACAERGECKAIGGYCKAEHKHCADTDACRVHGNCEDDELGCRAGKDADCAKSTRCKDEGACKKIGNQCAKDDCSTTFMCRAYGLCGKAKGECAAVTAEGCKASMGCRERGQCAVGENLCVAGQDSDCANTPGCKLSGRCSVKNGNCAAVTAKDCAASPECTIHGRCTPSEGRCVVGSNADCERALVCSAKGNCIADRSICRAPSDDARCRAQPECAALGQCKWAGYSCVAASDADCKASEVCKARGYCVLRQERPFGGDAYCFVTP